MGQSIHIPATLAEATERLTGIESLLTAKGWERAAIVAAFVRLGEIRGRHVNTDMTTPQQFAGLGIAGLRSHNTVRHYVEQWLEAHDGIHPEPGAEVTLPTGDYPPREQASDDPPQPPKPEVTDLSELWGQWLNGMGTLMIKGARLMERTEAEHAVDVYGHFAVVLYQRFSERKLDAEYAHLLDEEAGRT